MNQKREVDTKTAQLEVCSESVTRGKRKSRKLLTRWSTFMVGRKTGLGGPSRDDRRRKTTGLIEMQAQELSEQGQGRVNLLAQVQRTLPTT